MKEIYEPKSGFWKNLFSYSGWGIGLLGLLIAIYSAFIKKDEPQLEYDILSSAKFINNNETSRNLKIFVDSLDVQENHLNITAYNIKVENKGSENIRHNDYDNDCFGLKIQDGRLLEHPVLLEVSDEHIKTVYPINDSIKDSTFIEIPRLILDSGDYFIIRVVLLHNINKESHFVPYGKIVGQKCIELNVPQPSTSNFWSLVVSGGFLVHIVRFVLYLIILIVVTIVAGVVIVHISEYIGRKKRQSQIKDLSKNNSLVKFVCDDYIEDGNDIIYDMYRTLSRKESELTTWYKKGKSLVHNKPMKYRLGDGSYNIERYHEIERMIDKGYLCIKDDRITVNKDAKRTVSLIFKMIKNSHQLSRSDLFQLSTIHPLEAEAADESDN